MCNQWFISFKASVLFLCFHLKFKLATFFDNSQHALAGHCPCSRLSINAIELHGRSSTPFTYHEPSLWLCAHEDNDRDVPQRRRVHSLPMPLLAPATLYVRVGYEFPVGQFLLTLERIVYQDLPVSSDQLADKVAGSEPVSTTREVVTAEWTGMCSVLLLFQFVGIFLCQLLEWSVYDQRLLICCFCRHYVQERSGAEAGSVAWLVSPQH